MPGYVAFLRGVSPTNAKMPDLVRCFEAAGFEDVKTVLTSGNVVFHASRTSVSKLEQRAEAAMQERLGRAFLTIVRPVDALRRMLEEDPYRAFRVPANAKRVVTFLRERPKAKPSLPGPMNGARILAVEGSEAFTYYVPGPRGAVFMQVLEKTFGKSITTRTWDTVKKVAR